MWKIIQLLVIYISVSSAQTNVRVPPNSCPEIFNYYQDQDNQIYGQIVVPNDGTRNYKIEVNTSFVGTFPRQSPPKLTLELVTPKEYLLESRQLTYKLKFSRQDVLPKITVIKFNGRVYCSGHPEPVGPAGITNLWLFKETMLSTSQVYVPAINTPPPISNRPTPPPFVTPRPIESSYPDIFGRPNGNPSTSINTNEKYQTDEDCGISDRTINLISRGEDTSNHEFPWLVALYTSSGINYEFQCTANLISPNRVVTAAHCLRFYSSEIIAKDDILLVLGRSNLSHWASSGAVLRTASRVIFHQNYKQNSGEGDVAIIVMNEPVTYRNGLKPICLWSGFDDLQDIVGKSGTVAGWGKDENEWQYLSSPKKVEMPIVSQDNCRRSNNDFYKLTSDNTFCAGERNGKGPCTGDSGSPLMIEKGGKFFLRGIVSTAILDRTTTKCNLREYIVFADVAKYTSWIRSNLH